MQSLRVLEVRLKRGNFAKAIAFVSTKIRLSARVGNAAVLVTTEVLAWRGLKEREEELQEPTSRKRKAEHSSGKQLK